MLQPVGFHLSDSASGSYCFNFWERNTIQFRHGITQQSRTNNPHQSPVSYLDASAVIRHPRGQRDQNWNPQAQTSVSISAFWANATTQPLKVSSELSSQRHPFILMFVCLDFWGSWAVWGREGCYTNCSFIYLKSNNSRSWKKKCEGRHCWNSQVKAAFHYALLSLRFTLLISRSSQDCKYVISYCIAEFLSVQFPNVTRCSNGS